MAFESKEIPLTEEDRQKILKLKKRTIIGAGIFGLFFFSILTGFGISEFNEPGPGKYFIGTFALFALGIFGFIIFFTAKKFRKDLENGLKKHVRGKITDKQRQVIRSGSGKNQTTTYYYYLFFDSYQLTIDRNHYAMAEPGDEIEIETAVESATVLNFNKLSGSSATSIGPQVIKQQTVFDQLGALAASTTPAYTHTNFNARPDKEELLSDEDVRTLRNEKSRRITRWIIFTLVFAIPFVIVYYAVIVILVLSIPGIYRYIIVFQICWAAIFILFRVYFLRKRIQPVNRDLAEGKKILQEKFVQEKIFSNTKMSSAYTTNSGMSGEYYYVKAGNSFTGVSRADFDAIKDNYPAIFHVAAVSGIILQVKPSHK
ncbi:MAG: hypothetical protein IAF38_22425 [Bacteroidia bacterium]|nr:hypothetical protein [Bacteroidia bacterium]